MTNQVSTLFNVFDEGALEKEKATGKGDKEAPAQWGGSHCRWRDGLPACG